ncbi:hypothetical protein Tco_0963462 [Tanacetum coccineum]
MIQRPPYSNRAPTRVSLGRMKEALGDRLMAKNIDPDCLKPQVKAAQRRIVADEAPIAAPRMSVLMDNDQVSCSTVKPTLMGNAVVDSSLREKTPDTNRILEDINKTPPSIEEVWGLDPTDVSVPRLSEGAYELQFCPFLLRLKLESVEHSNEVRKAAELWRWPLNGRMQHDRVMEMVNGDE